MRRAALLSACLGVSCANTHDNGGDFTPIDSGPGLTADVNGGLDVATETPVIDPDAACGAVAEQATLTPVNLFVMFEKSQSMGPYVTSQKWAGARKGLAAFVGDSSSAGLRIALGFYPRKVDGTPECDSAPYEIPRVPFDVLPANGPPLLAAIDAEAPDGFKTPMYPAIRGALRGVIDALKTRPGEAGAILLVTDGAPEGPAPMCGTVDPVDPKVLAEVAATGLAYTPSIRTFVVGLPGVNVAIANQIAAAGGSTSAVLVTDPTKIESQFRDALAAIRGKAVPCEIALPTKVAKGEISFSLVNVRYTKGGSGAAEDLAQDPTCASGFGWRYDDVSKPTKILFCPKTCDEIHGDPKAKVEVLLGCKTKLK